MEARGEFLPDEEWRKGLVRAVGGYLMTILSQALRSRLGQPDSVENLAKVLATSGLQDFL
jgi:hypothetical protein